MSDDEIGFGPHQSAEPVTGKALTTTNLVETYCSFCGKPRNAVKKLVISPHVSICNECVDLCLSIIREEDKAGG